MTQFKMNEVNSLEVVKDILTTAKLEGDTIVFNPKNFESFGDMLHAVANPFQGVSKEIQLYIISFLKENNITKSVFRNQ